jgi:dienelactone hydrolase
MRKLTALLILAAAAPAAPAAVQTKVVEYTHDGTTHKGFLAYDDAGSGKRPGVLVLHEWWGLNEDAKNRAKMLAELGYVAFCGDMYGDGKVVDHPKDAGAMASAVRKDVQAWRAKAQAALDTLKAQPNVDGEKLAAIGYCFGGSTALQLAYSGADLDAVATFHAALPAPTPEEAKAIKARILVCHGADDAFIPAEAISKFKAALDAANVKYQFESYPGAVHSFTVKGIDEKMVKGLAYNAEADKKSWEQMQALFKEALGK